MAEVTITQTSSRDQILGHTDLSSTVPAQNDSHSACPACLNLDYDLFEGLADARYEEGFDMRYHTSTFKDINASAQGGCRLCSILYQGITFFWKDPEKDKERGADHQTMDSSIENVENESDAEYASENEEESEVSSSAFDSTPYLIFLELRPGKPLSLFRTCDLQLSYGEVRTRLEFFTQTVMLKDWLQECTTQHSHCLAPLPKLPTRLVHIAGEPRLVETNGLVYSRYITLIHCWGDGINMIKTTNRNFKLRTTGIDWEELPQVFKDAISVARHIDCQWIWIDSLCIIQDDKIDWKEESAKMADIYSNSFLNIAATFSSSSLGSFFSHRKCVGDHYDDEIEGMEEWDIESVEIVDNSSRTDMGLLVRVAHSPGHSLVFGRRMMDRSASAPLLGRAWVLQERLLAPRTLHFGSSELLWECNTSLACECTGSRFHNSTKSLKGKFANVCQHRASREEILDLWLQIVDLYSSLELTKISDRPFALAGIASRIFDELESDYLAGIWAADLPRALLWTAYPRSDERKRQPLGGPTWSWMSQYQTASSRSTAGYRKDMSQFVQDERLQVHHLHTFCDYFDGNPFGSIYSGQLDMTAAFRRGIIVQDDRQWIGRSEYHIAVRNVLALLWADCPAVDGLVDDTKVLCLSIGMTGTDIRSLVLKPSSGNTHYTRIGVVLFSSIERNVFDHAKVKRFKIL